MTILTATEKRLNRRSVRRRIREIRRASWQARARYAGGLEAERRSHAALQSELRRQARAEFLSRQGRRIDLLALLAQRRPDGMPLWALADPCFELQRYGKQLNGLAAATAAGEAQFSIRARSSANRYSSPGGDCMSLLAGSLPAETSVLPAGIPALPPRIRRLATDQRIRRRARFVGLLYQPDEWRQADPDPALVVEWFDRPGEYYCLAVWGVDGPAIMEFVD